MEYTYIICIAVHKSELIYAFISFIHCSEDQPILSGHCADTLNHPEKPDSISGKRIFNWTCFVKLYKKIFFDISKCNLNPIVYYFPIPIVKNLDRIDRRIFR